MVSAVKHVGRQGSLASLLSPQKWDRLTRRLAALKMTHGAATNTSLAGQRVQSLVATAEDVSICVVWLAR